MIRPYLPRATVARMPRRPGRPPSAEVAARRSLAAELVLQRPQITPAELARELEISPSLAQLTLADLRRIGLAPPPVAVAADGRRLTRPLGETPRWAIPADVVARLRAAAGVEAVGEAITIVLDRLENPDSDRKAP